MNVLIFGHSFTRRLCEWCVPRGLSNLNLDPNRLKVFWHGIGGASIQPHHPKSLQRDINLIADLQISIVYVDIGSNDLCDAAIQPEQFVEQISTFASQLLDLGCNIVILSEILPRQNNDHYNSKVSTVNALLEGKCSYSQKIVFWRHSRNNYNKRYLTHYVARDGVHVGETGLPRFYSSVRGAVLFAEKKLAS